MSYPVFMVPAGDILPIPFATYGKTNPGSITMTGLAVTDIEIYKDGSTTQRASDAGYTLLDTDGIDFDGITGIHGFSIDTGDNTDSGFYTVGAWFTVVVSTITVDGETVSFIAAQFRIVPAESSAGVPKVDVSHFGGTAGTFASGVPEVKTASIAANAITAAATASDFGAEIADAVWDEALAGHLGAGSTGDALDAAGTGGGGPSASDIADAVWDEALAGHVGAGSTGEALGEIHTQTALIPANPTAVTDIPLPAAIADGLLVRNIAGGSDGGRTVTSAMRRIRNRNKIAGGILTTYEEDDSTPDHTAVVTTATGDPIIEVDPA